MKNNNLMFLNIQLFAENEEDDSVVSSTETEQKDSNDEKETSKEKSFTRNEVNKMINAERNKLKAELLKEFEDKKTEAEKLAKMDAEQKLNYELKQTKKEKQELQNQLNSLTLQKEANSYASEKGLPIGYIEDFDYANETAESVKEKIDKLVNLRSNDLEGYLKDKLKQNPPKAINDTSKNEDPYTKGFKDYMNNKK